MCMLLEWQAADYWWLSTSAQIDSVRYVVVELQLCRYHSAWKPAWTLQLSLSYVTWLSRTNQAMQDDQVGEVIAIAHSILMERLQYYHYFEGSPPLTILLLISTTYNNWSFMTDLCHIFPRTPLGWLCSVRLFRRSTAFVFSGFRFMFSRAPNICPCPERYDPSGIKFNSWYCKPTLLESFESLVFMVLFWEDILECV